MLTTNILQVVQEAEKCVFFTPFVCRCLVDVSHSDTRCEGDHSQAGIGTDCDHSISSTSYQDKYEKENNTVQDSFYKTLTPEDHARAHENLHDFDNPGALDMEMLAAVMSCTTFAHPSTTDLRFRQCLADLKACKQTNIPVYSFHHHQRLPEIKYLYGATIIISACV